VRKLLPRLAVLGLAAAVVVVVIGLGRVTPAAPAPVTALVTRDTLENTVELSGAIAARDTRTSTFGASGTVASLLVAEGDEVVAGQVLATLDDTIADAQVAAAAATLASAKARLAADLAGPTKLDRTVARDPVRQATVSTSAARTAAGDARRQGDAALKAAREQRDAAKARLAADRAAALTPAVIAADQAAVEAADSAVRQAGIQRTAALHQANAALSTAQAALAAARHAYTLRVAASPKALIAADRAAVANAALSLANAHEALDLTSIRAPIAGTVTSIGFHVGDRVSPSMTSALGLGSGTASDANGAIELATLDDLRVQTTASEIDVPMLREGQAVQLALDALPGVALGARICDLGRVGTPAQGVVEYPVTICLAEPADGLRVGMSADASVPVERRADVLVIPTEAVREVDGQTFADVLRQDGSIETVRIETGLTSGSRVEVMSGLLQGQQVVLPPLPAVQ